MNRTARIIFAVTCCFLISGCPRQNKPLEIELDIPESVGKQTSDVSFNTPGKWWKSFNDEQLNSLIELSLNDNLTLNQAWQRVEQARLIAEIAGANILPSVDLTAGASRSRTITPPADNKTYNSLYSTGLVVNYELDLWGRVAANAAAGVYQWQAGQQDYEAAKISIASQIASAWFGYIETSRRLELIDKQIKINEDTLSIITIQFKRGQSEAVDVLQQRQLLESNYGDKKLILSQLDVLKTQLAVLTGRSPGNLELAKKSLLPDIGSLPETGSTVELLKRRPDIQSAYLTVKSYDERVAAALADKMPKISLSAAITTSDDQLKNLFDNWSSNIAGNLVMPIFDSGRKNAELERQRSLKLEAIYAYTETVYNSIKEVRDAFSREQNQKLYIESLDKQLKLSEQSVERVRDNYTKGRGDFLRFLTTQLSQQNLELRYVSAKKDLIDYRIDLYKALAGEIDS